MPPTRAHLGGLAADLFRLVNPLLADEPTVSSPGNVVYAVEQEEEDATGSEATIDGHDGPGEPVVEHQSEDNNVDAPALEIVQAANQAVDVQVEARQDVVDPLDGNDNRPLGSWADEPLNARPSSPKLKQLHALPVNDTMDSPTVAETAFDKQNTRSGRRARAWQDQNLETHGTRSGGNRRGRRNAKRRSDGNGQDSAGSGQAASSEGDNGEDGTRDAEGDSGRNDETSGGRNTGGGGGGEGSGGGSGASTEIVVEDGEVVEGSNRGDGSQGVDNWREGSGGGGQGDGRCGEAGVRRAPLNTEFLRRLLQESADAEQN
ncbi:hypothetical protein FRC07_006619 [Ceratobasidium sp. 392]|nr:hypothetical protein FRC07_006619 [Ceratobasidium sp. 392]